MSHRILITGGSGYLGGSILSRWVNAKLPTVDKLYALVRNDEQAEAVKRYGAESITFDVNDQRATHNAIVENRITVVFFLINAGESTSQVYMIEALAKVKEQTGLSVHLLHTTGAKLFSSHAGAPTDAELSDARPDLYDIQKKQQPPVAWMQKGLDANNTVIEQAEAHGVNSYIFVPCIVYGRGEGFGNIISIQTQAIIKAARAIRAVCAVDDGEPTWPVCHISDTVTLYLQILHKILADDDPGHGKNGYYLAASGSVSWLQIYTAFAHVLAESNVVDSAHVKKADAAQLKKMAETLGCADQPDLVPVHIGGSCTFAAHHGKRIGWTASFAPEHILESARAEVDLVLANI